MSAGGGSVTPKPSQGPTASACPVATICSAWAASVMTPTVTTTGSPPPGVVVPATAALTRAAKGTW